MKVFLGGTCNGSTWRDEMIPHLRVDYFNPVVEDWTPADAANEIVQRQECDICLYFITPKMTGVYSIAEVVEDSIKRPNKTIFAFTDRDGDLEFTPAQLKSLRAVGDMVGRNGGLFISKSADSVEDMILAVAGRMNYGWSAAA